MSGHSRTDTSPERATDTRFRWDGVRAGLALLYFVAGIAHLVLAVRSPGVYEGFATQALFGAYTDAWRSFVVPNLAVLVPLVGFFEVAIAVTLLWRNRAVSLGHLAGGLFQAGLVFSGPWGPINAVLALLHFGALRRSYPTAIPSLVGAWWRGA
jgi:hypothetical protein